MKPPPQVSNLPKGVERQVSRLRIELAQSWIDLVTQEWAGHNGSPRLFRSPRKTRKEQNVYCPATPLLTSTFTTTRRFSARPCADSLDATGLVSPIMPGATMCLIGMLPDCWR